MTWIFIAPVLIWALICLTVVFYMLFKAYGIRDMHSDDCFALTCLFFQLLFMPIWMPIKHLIQKRESRKIQKYVDGIRTKRRKPMKCHKCGGLMVRENISDFHGGTSFFGWRCVPCGEIIDDIILKNREERPPRHKERKGMSWNRKKRQPKRKPFLPDFN